MNIKQEFFKFLYKLGFYLISVAYKKIDENKDGQITQKEFEYFIKKLTKK